MVPKKKIDEILDGYDLSKLTIATLCSHSSLQIFHGARKMGFKTLGLVTKNNQKIYDAFPLAHFWLPVAMVVRRNLYHAI